jgi:hypothetical protein
MSSTITLGSNTYTLVSLPTSPGLAQLDVTMSDAVAVVSSPFVPGQTQTQVWPGADAWSMTITLPKMARALAARWRGFMAELRGMSNVFQIGDPYCTSPLGSGNAPVNLGNGSGGSSTGPVCVTSGTNNLAMSTLLYTGGWIPSINGQLLAGDYIQIGYRLYQVCEAVNSDSSGNATISIWPSLRETPANGAALILNNTKGVFRLARNQRTWHNDMTGLMSVSFQIVEVR